MKLKFKVHFYKLIFRISKYQFTTRFLFWFIKDYAYNSTPDAPINAGQTTLGIEDNSFSKTKVVALHKRIELYNLQNTTNYKLLNMSGQEVLKGETNNRDYVIEASTLTSGVYILELTDSNSGGIIRKKVVLQ